MLITEEAIPLPPDMEQNTFVKDRPKNKFPTSVAGTRRVPSAGYGTRRVPTTGANPEVTLRPILTRWIRS
jgi:hypothetical protein